VAPGVGIVSAKAGGGYQSMDGTSMATPHVAGLAALLLEAEPKATVARLEKAILGACARPRGMSAERGGRGIPSAVKALEAL
jgi:subtilisin family serine protease